MERSTFGMIIETDMSEDGDLDDRDRGRVKDVACGESFTSSSRLDVIAFAFQRSSVFV